MLCFLQTGEQLNSSMAALLAEKDRLTQSMSKKEAELSSLKKEAQLKECTLQQERDKTIKELGELQSKLKEKVGLWVMLMKKTWIDLYYAKFTAFFFLSKSKFILYRAQHELLVTAQSEHLSNPEYH